MCYEYERYQAALAAEKSRRSAVKTEQEKESAPSKPAEPEKRVKEKEPVPA